MSSQKPADYTCLQELREQAYIQQTKIAEGNLSTGKILIYGSFIRLGTTDESPIYLLYETENGIKAVN